MASDANARTEMMQKSGQLGVPVILIDDTLILGFEETKLRETLEMAD